MGVEPTTLPAKDRINGFEGHEDHRTLFASVVKRRMSCEEEGRLYVESVNCDGRGRTGSCDFGARLLKFRGEG